MEFLGTFSALAKFFKSPFAAAREIRDRDSFIQSFIILGIQMLLGGFVGLVTIGGFEAFMLGFLMPAIFGMGTSALLMAFGSKFRATFNKMIAIVAGSSIPSSCGLVLLLLFGLMKGSAFLMGLMVTIFLGTMIAGLGIQFTLVAEESKFAPNSASAVIFANVIALFAVVFISSLWMDGFFLGIAVSLGLELGDESTVKYMENITGYAMKYFM